MKKSYARDCLSASSNGIVQHLRKVGDESFETEPFQINEAQNSNGVIIGSLSAFDDKGQPLVKFTQNRKHFLVTAKTVLTLGKKHINRPLALMFEEGDWYKPIVIGLLQQNPNPFESDGPSIDQFNKANHINLKVDGRQIVLEAEQEIVLRCGSAAIRLCKNGRIVVRGKSILSRSTGLNRIKGGAVQIN